MKASFHPIAATLVCLGAFALAACTLTPSGSQNSYKATSGKLEIERVEGNRLLAANLKIQNPIEKLVDGRQIAQFEIINTLSVTKRFEYAVDWYDADGFRIDVDNRHFEPVSLRGHGSMAITITAPKAGEKFTWKLILSDPNEVH